MAALELKNQGSLSFEPTGLKHDSFNGWTMRSYVEVALRSSNVSLGEFMSGPSMRDEIEQFVNERLGSYAYEPQYDGDLPCLSMSLHLLRQNGLVRISFWHQYQCSMDDQSSWMQEINDALNACSRLGVRCQSSIERMDHLMMITTWFRFVVEQDLADKFLTDLLIELDAQAEK
jgi:hypothetical protein